MIGASEENIDAMTKRLRLKEPAPPLLHRAAIAGDCDLIELLVTRGTDVDLVDGQGRTALHLAARNGQDRAAVTLLAHGANPNTRTEYGVTPLMAAVPPIYPGEVFTPARRDLVRILLAHGADMQARDSEGQHVLFRVIELGIAEDVKFFIENGADIGGVDARRRTPLHEAVIRGHLDVVKLLLREGASFSVFDEDGWSPLHKAAYHGRREIINFLLDGGCPVDLGGDLGATPLHSALSGNFRNVAIALLKRGASLTTRDRLGNTPLHVAATTGNGGNPELVEILLHLGSDIEAENSNGETAIATAVRESCDKGLGQLLNHGPRISWNALWLAAKNQWRQPWAMLVSAGADLNAIADNERSWTLLHRAVWEGNTRLVALLLETGANPNPYDRSGATPLDLARRDPETAELLRRFNAVEGQPFYRHPRKKPWAAKKSFRLRHLRHAASRRDTTPFDLDIFLFPKSRAERSQLRGQM